MTPDEYYTIAESCTSEIKVKGSKFIGYAAPVQDKDGAEQFLQSIRKNYFDATHHCFAYQVGLIPHVLVRLSDDGEPSGTAGKPILQAITAKNWTDIIVIVVRYFGGTKLGTGGLVRAYGDSAAEVLSRCRAEQRLIYENLRIQFPYDEINTIMRCVHHAGGKAGDTVYAEQATMDVAIRKNEVLHFCDAIIHQTRGRATVISL